jgi:hypothetical protein
MVTARSPHDEAARRLRRVAPPRCSRLPRVLVVGHFERMSRHRRPPATKRLHQGGGNTVERHVPPDLRRRLEAARLDLLGLFRALDSLHIAAYLPDELRDLFELDADFAEALAVLDHSVQGYDLVALQRDTLASLDDLLSAKADFLVTLDPNERARLDSRLPVVHATLDPREAYHDIPNSGAYPRRAP